MYKHARAQSHAENVMMLRCQQQQQKQRQQRQHHHPFCSARVFAKVNRNGESPRLRRAQRDGLYV